MINAKRKSFSQAYCRACQDAYGSLGFVRYKRTFARIVGDILQSFTLITFPLRSTHTVAFAIQPLCKESGFYLNQEDYRLDDFLQYKDDNIYRYMGWHVPDGEGSFAACLDSMLNAINTHIIPAFDRAINCETALCETLRIELELDELRRQYLKMNRIEDCGMPWLKAVLFDENRYWMALKLHNMLYARLYLENRLDNNIKGLKYNVHLASTHNNDSDFYSSQVRRAELALKETQTEVDRFLANDMAYFENRIAANEVANITYISNICPQLLRRGQTTL